MWGSSYALIRLVALGALGLVLLAAALGRDESPSPRQPAADHLAALAGGVCRGDRTKPQLLDLASGVPTFWPFPAEARFELASPSPWKDGQGRRQFVGRRQSLHGEAATELARYEYPSGRPLGHLTPPSLPASPPCWTPGVGAVVVFAGCDGALYRADFEPRGFADAPTLAKLRWGIGQAGADYAFVSHPCQSESLGKEWMVATLGLQAEPHGPTPQEERLWWLRTDPSGTVIGSAGPLIAPPRGDGDREVYPAVGHRPDGSLLLAFLTPQPSGDTADLFAAPLRYDPATSGFLAHRDEVRRLARGCRLWTPVLSLDGEAVHVLAGDRSGLRLVRVAMPTWPAPSLGPINLAADAPAPPGPNRL